MVKKNVSTRTLVLAAVLGAAFILPVWPVWSPQTDAEAACRRSCEDGEKRDARGCCIAKKAKQRKADKPRKKQRKQRKQREQREQRKKDKRAKSSRKTNDKKADAERAKVGAMVVNSTVSAARVFLDGKEQADTAPMTIDGLKPGSYVLEVRAGQQRWKRVVEIRAGERVVQTAEFASPASKASPKRGDGGKRAGNSDSGSRAPEKAPDTAPKATPDTSGPSAEDYAKLVRPLRGKTDAEKCYLGVGEACARLRNQHLRTDTTLATGYYRRSCDHGVEPGYRCRKRVPSSDVAFARTINEQADLKRVQKKDLAGAIARYRIAVRLHPSPGYFLNLCSALHQQGQDNWAAEACVAVLPYDDEQARKKAAAILDDIARQRR